MKLPLAERPPMPVLVTIPALVALMLTLFAWPAARLAPRDLPLGVVGPVVAVGPPGAFAVRHYPDAAAARDGIRQREVYGAVAGKQLLVASAASPVVAQLLERALARPGTRVVDVVPAPAADPRGSAFASSVLPLVLAGIVLGGILALASRPGRRQLLLLVGAAAGAGLAGVAIVHAWLHVLTGSWWQEAGVLALTVLAIAATLTALAALLGGPGLLLGAALMMLVGNPLSAAGSAPELLPQPLGAIGRLLPPGAGAGALRSTAYFDGAAAGVPLAVLGVWALAAVATLAAKTHVRRVETRRTAVA